MLKLSETFMPDVKTEQETAVNSNPNVGNESGNWQSLVLLNDVLDADKLLLLPELEKLAKYVYGRSVISRYKTDHIDEIEDWLHTETYKGLAQVGGSTTMVYPFKTSFDDVALDSNNGEYTAPFNAVLLRPEGFDNYIIALCCGWGDGLFRNDFYPLGLVADTDDLEQLIDDKI